MWPYSFLWTVKWFFKQKATHDVVPRLNIKADKYNIKYLSVFTSINKVYKRISNAFFSALPLNGKYYKIFNLFILCDWTICIIIIVSNMYCAYGRYMNKIVCIHIESAIYKKVIPHNGRYFYFFSGHIKSA